MANGFNSNKNIDLIRDCESHFDSLIKIRKKYVINWQGDYNASGDRLQVWLFAPSEGWVRVNCAVKLVTFVHHDETGPAIMVSDRPVG